MASIKRTGITDKGKDLITREIAGITELTFTKMSASSNKLADTVNLETLINIDGVKQSVSISRVEKIGTDKVKVTATFNNSGLMAGYLMETLGIYARDTAGVEILFAVVVADTADFMPATNGVNLSTVTTEILFNISNTANVSMKVDTEALVTVKMLNDLKSETDRNFVKYTDLATETRAGIITYAKVKEIAPRPDLSPYIPFSKGYRDSARDNFVIRANNADTWVPQSLNMYNPAGNFVGTYHTNGNRAYYKVPNRNGGNWNEIMDNHDMNIRDNKISNIEGQLTAMNNDRNGIRNSVSQLWTKANDLYHRSDNDTVRDIRLVGYIAPIVAHANQATERVGYIVTGLVNGNNDHIVDQVQMRAFQIKRGGSGGQNWYTVPFG